MAKGPVPLPVEVRFWPKVEKSGGPDVCWPWIGSLYSSGYGQFFVGSSQIVEGRNRTTYAHRVAWALTNGPIPGKLCILHSCDNPPCCNPSHLFLGTRAINNNDCKAKDRNADHHGTNNPNAKLTEVDVAGIRLLRADGLSQQAIADQFGVTQVQISRVLRGKAWG